MYIAQFGGDPTQDLIKQYDSNIAILQKRREELCAKLAKGSMGNISEMQLRRRIQTIDAEIVELWQDIADMRDRGKQCG